MLQIENNEYRQLKYPVRRVIGIPGSLIKVLSGDGSLYTYLNTLILREAAIGISCTSAIFAVPALTAFLWSNHNAEKDNNIYFTTRQQRINTAKKVFAYTSSLLYSIDVGFAYYHSALNIPKNMGILKHGLEQYKNYYEKIGYGVITAATFIETTVVFLAFARLNANMFGLVKLNENNKEVGCWVSIENSWIKKGIGSFAVLFKVFNTAVSATQFFRHTMPFPANIAFVGYSSLGGFVGQSSLLICDPLDTASILHNPEEKKLMPVTLEVVEVPNVISKQQNDESTAAPFMKDTNSFTLFGPKTENFVVQEGVSEEDNTQKKLVH